MNKVIVYGKVDCPDTQRARALLDRERVPYEFEDVLVDEALRAEAARLGGSPSVPVIVTPSGAVTVEPTDEELRMLLQHESLIDGPTAR